MKARAPLWKVVVSTTSEAEDAVMELLQNHFGTPSSSYKDVESGEVTVAVYLTQNPKECRQVLECASPLALWHRQPTEKRRRAGAVQDAAALRAGLTQIKNCGLNIGSGKISIQRVRREDWAESWKRHFKSIDVGPALLIKPSWSRRRPKHGQAVVVLDPGLSFGTGQHPTTGFCLRQLAIRRAGSNKRSKARRSPLDPRASTLSLLDIGTGSGILAIAAAKLGYIPVDAFDFDPEAVRIARENARKNHVGRNTRITRGDVTKLPSRPSRRYDLVCANLISTLLLGEQRRILSRLKQNGVLVIAGILKAEFPSVQKAYERAGMRLIASRTEKEWRSGAFRFFRRHD